MVRTTGRRTRGQEAPDLVLGDQTMEAVGAEEIGVAGHRLEGRDVDLDLLADAEGAQDLVLARIRPGLLGPEHALAHEGRHQRVVLGEGLEGAVPQAVEAAVADVGDPGSAVAVDQQADDRRPHALELVVLAGRFVDHAIRLADRVDEALGRAAIAHGDEGADHLRRHLARDLAAAMAPEPVGDDQQDLAALRVVPAEEGVLVDPADDADVGRARDRRLPDSPGRVPIGIGGVEGHGIPAQDGGGRRASQRVVGPGAGSIAV